MKHTYDFGKIDYFDKGRKTNAVEVEVELTEKKGEYVFSARAAVYDNTKTDYVCAGQCLDSLMIDFPQLKNNKTYCLIESMWEKYHLNDIHGGTPMQEEALKEAVEQGILSSYGANNYEASCDYLKSIDLYEDKNYLVERKGEQVPYVYGTGWLTESIPEKDLKIIKELVEGKYKSFPEKEDR